DTQRRTGGGGGGGGKPPSPPPAPVGVRAHGGAPRGDRPGPTREATGGKIGGGRLTPRHEGWIIRGRSGGHSWGIAMRGIILSVVLVAVVGCGRSRQESGGDPEDAVRAVEALGGKGTRADGGGAGVRLGGGPGA